MVEIKIENKKMVIINIYAPNTGQRAFFKELHERLGKIESDTI